MCHYMWMIFVLYINVFIMQSSQQLFVTIFVTLYALLYIVTDVTYRWVMMWGCHVTHVTYRWVMMWGVMLLM